MTVDSHPFPPFLATFLERLDSGESLDFEFKAAKGGLPKSLWPTVSAFANTQGGWIVLGVDESGGKVELTGVTNAPRQLQEFFDLSRNPNKISVPPCGETDARIELLSSKQLVVIRVAAAPRRMRPVYLNGNPYEGTYIRRHGGDYKCSKSEVDRMIREASEVGVDSTVLDRYGVEDLDVETLSRYRRRFQTQDPGNPRNGFDDQRFIESIGAFRHDRESGASGLTLAGLLLLGKPEAIQERRTRHLIDYRLLSGDEDIDTRWDDRVAWEGNLLGAFETIYPRLTTGQPVAFHLEGATRVDQGPVQVALREALVNFLVHADYADSQASLIKRSSQGCIFRNPGNSRIPEYFSFR